MTQRRREQSDEALRRRGRASNIMYGGMGETQTGTKTLLGQ
jgi:hypothetical protein